MRIASVLAFLLTSLGAACAIAQQPAACCVCTCAVPGAGPIRWQPGIDFGGKNGSMRVESCRSVCKKRCAPSGVQNQTTENQSCTPPAADMSPVDLKSALRSAISGAGKNPWRGNTDELLDASTLRRLYEPALNAREKEALRQTSDEDVVSITKAALASCADEFRTNVFKMPGGWFDWAWSNKNEAGNMYNAVHKDDNINGVRDRFVFAQGHDGRIKNVLYCFNSSEVRGLVDRYPEPKPSSQVRAHVMRPEGPAKNTVSK